VDLFDRTQIALEQALAGASARQQALAHNLANANTPGFRRSDVDFHATLASALESGAPDSALGRLSFERAIDSNAPARADGNTVDVDKEMSTLTENSLDYQALVTIAHARLKMLGMAIGGRS